MNKKKFMKKWRAGTYPYREEFTKDLDALINSVKTDVKEKCTKIPKKRFQELRFDRTEHLGSGDIRLTIADQSEIVQKIRDKE